MVGLVAFLCGGVMVAGKALAGGTKSCPNFYYWDQSSNTCVLIPVAPPSAPAPTAYIPSAPLAPPSAPAPTAYIPSAPPAPSPPSVPLLIENPNNLRQCTIYDWIGYCNEQITNLCKCKEKGNCTPQELTDEMRQASSPSPQATPGPTGCFANQTDGFIGD
jgi:hypothetical protein